MGTFGRSWQLTKASWSVLKTDKELLLLPILSGGSLLVLLAGYVFGMGYHRDVPDEVTVATAVPLFLFYVVSYTVSFYFQAALVAGAMQRFEGGDPTLGSALGAANRRFGSILMWGVVAGTVGMALRALQERSELLGKIVIGLVGVAWSLATYFMVPVLVMERKTVGDSFSSSWALFKRTWGETVVGGAGFGLLSLLGFLLLLLPCALLFAMGLPVVAIAVGALGLIALSIAVSALSGIYLASVYRYAITGEVASGFSRDALVGAFRPKS